MENSNLNKPEHILDPKRARAWIITLVLGIVVCLGLIIYILVTHDYIFSFVDSSLFKAELTWLGVIGFILWIITYFLFWISVSIFKFLPYISKWGKIMTIAGILLLLASFIILFISYDLKHRYFFLIGDIGNMTGLSMLFFTELIEDRFSNIWRLISLLILCMGLFFLYFGYSI